MENLSPEVVNLLFQIPILGIFVWYTLKLLHEQRVYLDARDQEWRKFLESQQHSVDRSMLLVVEALGKMTDSIVLLTDRLVRIETLMTTHDAKFDATVSTMSFMTETAKKPPKGT